jgi:hypothetical protein
MDTEQSTERQMLEYAKRQTELLSQINLVLWVFLGLALFAGALVLLTS